MKMRWKTLVDVAIWVDRVNRLAEEEDLLVVVEGRSDFLALRKLGVRGKMLVLREFLEFLDEQRHLGLGGRAFLILTDFDKEGRLLYRRLTNLVWEMGGIVRTDLREKLHKCVRIERIEDLKHLMSDDLWNLVHEGRIYYEG